MALDAPLNDDPGQLRPDGGDVASARITSRGQIIGSFIGGACVLAAAIATVVLAKGDTHHPAARAVPVLPPPTVRISSPRPASAPHGVRHFITVKGVAT